MIRIVLTRDHARWRREACRLAPASVPHHPVSITEGMCVMLDRRLDVFKMATDEAMSDLFLSLIHI